MVEIEVDPHPTDAGAAVLAIAAELGLSIATDGPVRKYPGSRHWHLRKPGRTGTLEITHWPEPGRMWVAYHSSRVGDGWVQSVALDLAKMLQNEK